MYVLRMSSVHFLQQNNSQILQNREDRSDITLSIIGALLKNVPSFTDSGLNTWVRLICSCRHKFREALMQIRVTI